MTYSAFYNIVRLGKPVEANSAVKISKSKVLNKLLPLLKEEGEYFGLIDAAGTTLQVAYEAKSDEYWVEVPREDLRGSFGARLSWESTHDLFASINSTFPLDGYDGFKFCSWK